MKVTINVLYMQQYHAYYLFDFFEFHLFSL